MSAALGAVRMALLNSMGASTLVHFRIRTLMFRACGIRIPLQSRIAPGVFIRTPALTLGRGSTINTGTIIDNYYAHVTIGDHVGIGVGVRILCAGHDQSDPLRRAGRTQTADVTVENGAWIGSGATILPGVRIEEGAIVAAGAVVTKDCPRHTLVAGVPARPVRTLEETAPNPGHRS